jgi:hypothetical protein
MAEMAVVRSLEFGAVLLMGFGWLQRRCQWMEHQSIRRADGNWEKKGDFPLFSW